MNSLETDRSFGVITTLPVVMLLCYCGISLSQQVARNYPVCSIPDLVRHYQAFCNSAFSDSYGVIPLNAPCGG
jgi:hypothetical protein